MPLITGSDSLNTAFTPVAGDFIVECSGGPVNLERQNATGTGYRFVGTILQHNAMVVRNPVGGAIYRFVNADPSKSPTCRADQ